MTKLSAFLLVALVAACGASSGNADAIGAGREGDGGLAGGTRKDAAGGACSALSPPGAVFSWQDNGAPECAVVVEATRMTSATQDFLEIVTGTSSALGVGMTVVAYGSTLEGTYNCKSDAGISSQYVDFVYTGTAGAVLQNCTITIVNAGAPGSVNAVGSFSAVLSSTTGGTITISNGVFNTPIPVTGS
jgi:hypothetical protein